jgi:hypothetical protein
MDGCPVRSLVGHAGLGDGSRTLGPRQVTLAGGRIRVVVVGRSLLEATFEGRRHGYDYFNAGMKLTEQANR